MTEPALIFWQAASGAVLALFVCVHLVLEGTVVLSPALTNGIAWLLEVTMLAQLVAPVIMLLILFHFYIAARKCPSAPTSSAFLLSTARALKSWIRGCGGTGVYCHYHSCWCILPCVRRHDRPAYQCGWQRQASACWLAGLLRILLPCVILHTGIGVYRLAVKFGFCVKATRPAWRKWTWIVMGCYLLLGAAALTRVWFLG